MTLTKILYGVAAALAVLFCVYIDPALAQEAATEAAAPAVAPPYCPRRSARAAWSPRRTPS